MLLPCRWNSFILWTAASGLRLNLRSGAVGVGDLFLKILLIVGTNHSGVTCNLMKEFNEQSVFKHCV